MDQSNLIIDFCCFSLGSVSAKTVFTAGVVLFNHILTYKGDIKKLTPKLQIAQKTIVETLRTQTDKDALLAMLLAEIRIIYKNADLLHTLLWNEEKKDDFISVHKALK